MIKSILCSSPAASISSSISTSRTASMSSSSQEETSRNNNKSVKKNNGAVKISNDDLNLNLTTTKNSEVVGETGKMNIAELKESLINSKKLQFTPPNEATSNDDIRKRSNTWPIKKAELNLSLTEYEKRFAEKIHKELGIDSGKQLKNPWGNLSYSQLIEKAIESSPWKSLSLQEIYTWFTKFVPFFKDKGNYKSTMGWKNSIRHNLSLHKRFIRVAVFQRHSSTNRTSTKKIRFVWTSLKYKPKSLRTIQNRNLLEFNHIRQQELYWHQNAVFGNSQQNMFNNYAVAAAALNQQQQAIDPNNVLNFYRFLNNQQNYLMMNNYWLQQQQQQQQSSNDVQNDNGDERPQVKRMKISENATDEKCTCSSCLKVTSSQQQQQQQQPRLHYPIPVNMNPSTKLINHNQGAQLIYPLPNLSKYPFESMKTQTPVDSSPFDLDDEDENETEIINIDSDNDASNNSSNNSKSESSSNDPSSYNFKRKLMDRYIHEDGTCFKKQKTSNNSDSSSQLATFLKTNRISNNLLKYAAVETSNPTQTTSTVGDNDNDDYDQTPQHSFNLLPQSALTSNNNNFGLLKTILNKKN